MRSYFIFCSMLLWLKKIVKQRKKIVYFFVVLLSSKLLRLWYTLYAFIFWACRYENKPGIRPTFVIYFLFFFSSLLLYYTKVLLLLIPGKYRKVCSGVYSIEPSRIRLEPPGFWVGGGREGEVKVRKRAATSRLYRPTDRIRPNRQTQARQSRRQTDTE